MRIATKTEADAVVFEKTITDGFCSKRRTKATVLGRVKEVAACPIGEVAYRAWDGNGFHIELPTVGKPSAELKQALEQLCFNGTVTAYVLGCGKATDLVVARNGRNDVELRFWVGGKMRLSDPRFLAP